MLETTRVAQKSFYIEQYYNDDQIEFQINDNLKNSRQLNNFSSIDFQKFICIQNL